MSAVLSLLAVMVKSWPESPAPMPRPVRLTVCSPEFAGMEAGGLIALIEGAWLTKLLLTVTVNCCGIDVFWPPPTVPPLSITTTVITAVPLAFGTGV